MGATICTGTECADSAQIEAHYRLKDQDKEKSFRETMSRLSREYWSTKTPEEKRLRGQKSAEVRWGNKKASSP